MKPEIILPYNPGTQNSDLAAAQARLTASQSYKDLSTVIVTPTRGGRSLCPRFVGAMGRPPLQALANATSANGVYAYGASSAFPTNTYQSSNYWVDVLFAPNAAATAPGAPTNVSASAQNAGAQLEWTAPASNGGSPITGYKITPYIGASAQTATTTSNAAATGRRHRPDQRHRLHLHGDRDQRGRHRPRIGAHPTRSRRPPRPRRPDRRQRHRPATPAPS